MRIDKLQVHNFRGFSDTEIVLNGKDAIFYGVNGMGKSSILDVCNLLFSRIMQEAAQDEQIKASLLGEKDVKVGEEETKITLFLEDQGNNFHYYRKRIQGKNLHNSKELKRVSEYMRKQYLGDYLETEEEYESDDTETLQKEFILNDENIPVYVFYGVDRYNEKTRKLRRRYTGAAGKLDAWRDSAFEGVINFRLFFEWFRGRQEYENSIRVETPNAEDPQLHAVKKAILNALGDGFSEIRVKVTEEDAELIVIKKELELAFYQLSEGEKSVIALVGDLSRRLAIANPKRENPLEGDGIVLIDEIDLHLHPKWQEKIFPALQNTFPNIQFIVSTHAPKVLESVDENIQVIRLHEDAETHLVLAEPMEPMNGWDVNTILEDYMDTEVYNRKTTELLEQINVYLNEKAILNALGDGFSEIRVKVTEEDAELIVIKKELELAFYQLSEGEKSVIALVGDLSRRLAIANPKRENPLEGDGIVLIDEIDLHLHPKWQEKIFPALQNTFPNIQFIVSTHAPKVLESVDENIQVIRLHEDAETHLVLAEPMEPMNGWDVNTILEDYMDTEVYNRKTTELLEQINVYLNEKAYDEAEKLVNKLAWMTSEENTKVVRARILIAKGR